MAPGASPAEQSSVWANLPVAVMLLILILTLLGLLIVIVRGRLVVPTPWDPKFTETGEMDLNGALSMTPIPPVRTLVQ